MKTRIINHMTREFQLALPATDKGERLPPVKIGPGLSATVDTDAFKAALKGNRALKALLDKGNLTTSEAATDAVTPAPVEATKDDSGDAEKPADLEDTADAEERGGKVKHAVKAVETAEVDAPKGGKRAAKKK